MMPFRCSARAQRTKITKTLNFKALAKEGLKLEAPNHKDSRLLLVLISRLPIPDARLAESKVKGADVIEIAE